MRTETIARRHVGKAAHTKLTAELEADRLMRIYPNRVYMAYVCPDIECGRWHVGRTYTLRGEHDRNDARRKRG